MKRTFWIVRMVSDRGGMRTRRWRRFAGIGKKLLACLRRRVTDRNGMDLIRMWLEAVVVEPGGNGTGGKRTRNEKGTPQGGVISPLVANLFLHWFDALFHGPQGPSRWADARLVRYADEQCATSAKGRGGPNVCNCLIDEGRPLGTGWQEQVPNHLRRLWSKALVVSTEGKGLGRTRSGDWQEEDRKGTADDMSKA